jgi:hypothetical protein
MFDDNDKDNLTPAERELEGALRGLKPAGVSIDRDRLMFAAGRASAGRSVFRWRVTSAAAAVLVGSMALTSLSRLGGPQGGEKIVYVNQPAATPSAPQQQQPSRVATVERDEIPLRSTLLITSTGEPNTLSIRDRALRWGVSAALPPARPAAQRSSAQPTVDQLLQ